MARSSGSSRRTDFASLARAGQRLLGIVRVDGNHPPSRRVLDQRIGPPELGHHVCRLSGIRTPRPLTTATFGARMQTLRPAIGIWDRP